MGFDYSKTSKASNDSALTKPKRGRPPLEQTALKNAMIDIFLEGLNTTVENRISSVADSVIVNLTKELDEKLERLEQNRVIHIHHKDGVREVEGTTHETFPTFLKAVMTHIPVMLVGPAGTGKTYAALQAANALGVPFYAISVGAQTSKSDIGGYMNAVGGYVRTQFREAYENGGLFLMDEIDAGNSNVLIFINAALSSSECAFPDSMIKKHENFFFVATGNTYGLGANRQYVGRNQIDAATLDRFITIDWPIDTNLERSLVSHLSFGTKWLKVVEAVRSVVNSAEYRIVISPRATIKGALLLENELPFDTVVESVLLSQASKDQREKLLTAANKAWS